MFNMKSRHGLCQYIYVILDLTCLSLKLRRCYFYVISTVSMTLVIIIINSVYCHIALYKLNCIVLLLLYMYIVYDSPLNLLDIGL